jgi:hypothetical protein
MDERGRSVKKWCAACAHANHADEFKDLGRKCEDCKVKQPHYGITDERGRTARTWCGSCAYSRHPNEKIFCTIDGCGTLAKANALCAIHQPGYIAAHPGASKESCAFLDALASEWRSTIRHIHYDHVAGTCSGSEHCCIPLDHKRKSDGYISLTDLSEVVRAKLPALAADTVGIAFEYQGSLFHGHPSMWADLDDGEQEKHPLFAKWLRDVAKWKACEEQGKVKVYYMLDTDFKQWKKQSVGTSVFSFCREASAHF